MGDLRDIISDKKEKELNRGCHCNISESKNLLFSINFKYCFYAEMISIRTIK